MRRHGLEPAPAAPAHLQHHHFLPSRYVGELISDAEADVREDDSYLFDLDNKVGRRPLCLLRPGSSGSLGRAGRGCQWWGSWRGRRVVNVKCVTLRSGWRGILHRCPLLWQHQPIHQPLV